METSKCGSSKLIVMTVLEPKDELDEVKQFVRNSLRAYDYCAHSVL